MTKVIAKKLGISYRTVNWHLRNLCTAHSARNSIHLMYLTHPFGNRALPDHPHLTQHENSILHMIVQGVSLRKIAEEKGITYATAKVHREHIRDKMETNSIRAAAALLLEMSLENNQQTTLHCLVTLPDCGDAGTGADR